MSHVLHAEFQILAVIDGLWQGHSILRSCEVGLGFPDLHCDVFAAIRLVLASGL